MTKYNATAVKILEQTEDYQHIVAPALLELTGDLERKSILDIGCGSGRFSRFLAARGATVTGVDRNPNQLERATQLAIKDDLPISYFGADVMNGNNLNNSFDLVLLAFVLIDCRNAEEVRNILRLAKKALRRGGSLIVADLHPHNLARENDVENACLTEGNYFDVGARFRSQARLIGGGQHSFFPNFHYPLGFLLDEVIAAGLVVSRLLEPHYASSFPTHMLLRADLS
jgi:2-polyprenyl-3-methyl-5-hydroxy-6-metoxy-1,4-benzoquinol methylase